jgi:hypothetical protein
MATVLSFVAAINRIEDEVKDIQSTQAAQTTAINSITKALIDLIAALGGQDDQQPDIDAVTADLQSTTETLNAAVGRDHER